MQIIDSQNKLDDFMLNIRSQSILGIDTEFVRERTYWPDLCLVQIATKNEEFIIDIKSDIDLSKFWRVLQDKSILKIIHSCKQDIEAIYFKSGIIPSPIFDTQIAAMFCDFTDSISYAQLVEKILHIKLDKDLQYSDWSKRPLDIKKYHYAINDVKYLIDIYNHIEKKLHSCEKASWLDEEMLILSTPLSVMNKNYPKSKKQLLKKEFHNEDILDNLKEFRENIAILNNLPRKRLLTDSNIAKIVEQRPKDIKTLNNILNERENILEPDYTSKILKIISKNTLQDNKLKKRFNTKLSKKQKKKLNELNKLLKTISQEHQICSRLIANQSGLKRLVCDDYENSKFLKGWRYDIFGRKAFNIVQEIANK
tara:strand:+ start:16597 stop:17697 length:1101 start_codon:yes stop_codon:yes gene_type:complete